MRGLKRLSNIHIYIFAILVVVMIVVNAMQFKDIDSKAYSGSKALYNYPTADIHTIMTDYHPVMFDLRLLKAFNLIGDNVRIIEPINLSIINYHMMAYGSIHSVEKLNYGISDVLNGFDVEPYIVLSNEDIPAYEQFRIAVNDTTENVDELILALWNDDILLFIDTSLLPDGRIEELRSSHR